jgi:hypothetical protein
LKFRVFSREAAAADICGRQPAERKDLRNTKPRSGDSKLLRELLPALRGLGDVYFGLDSVG